MRLSEVVVEVLRDEGVDRVFGNPGTTELPLVDSLVGADALPYTLGVHEGPLVAMADGYARATRRTSFVNLHVAAGTANGLIGMLNAMRSRIPLVVVAGQQDSRHLVQEPMLAGDLVGLAAAACKHAEEARRAQDVPTMLRRAFRAAATPPCGPVFVSVPMDLMEEDVEGIPPGSVLEPGEPALDLDRAVQLLREAQRPAIVAGDGIGRSGGVDAAVRLVESLGAVVYGAPMYDQLDFPLDHPAYAGMLVPENERIRAVLDRHDVVLLAGLRAFVPHHYSDPPAVGPGTRLLQIDEDPATVGRTYPVEVGLVGAVGPVLAGLAEAFSATSREYAPVPPAPLASETGRLSPRAAAGALAAGLPEGAVLVEESITTGLLLRERLRLREPGSFQHTVGGGLGWGIGAAVGVALGRPDRPVVAALGDGCAMFGLQGLWTAAREGTSTTFVVFANGEYRTLKQTLTTMRGGEQEKFVGMDLEPPRVAWTDLSAALGVPGVVAESTDHLTALVGRAGHGDGPLLIEVPVTPYEGPAPASS
ncbi:thiamine pyrophosphate-binding protein [Nocardioides mangrovicus]|uniref:Thiamine pyrophosphate-binding protein n=1 Tax=Nocardioides mangrovicus TaxID=2478913 RepID=A0A3L8NYP8_9ACTN|nr:thiamine pyrophosphate-binding protein [Nocardioides mangrovicus]RLV47693.1 thiamine pyrophosphate-binding protein [Nocardioides mangrovicus]